MVKLLNGSLTKTLRTELKLENITNISMFLIWRKYEFEII